MSYLPEENRKYKYVHIMLQDTVTHNIGIINMINSNKIFVPGDHLFVTLSKKLFEACGGGG